MLFRLWFLGIFIVILFIIEAVCASGNLKIADSVSWTSLVEFRDSNRRCEDEFELIKENGKWDFCYDVSKENFGGDYRVDDIESPTELMVTDRQLFANRNCFCDKNCGHYGDCCIDAAQQASLDDLDEDQDIWTCASLPGAEYSTVRAIYTVGKCNDNWNTEISESPDAAATKFRCQMDSAAKTHYTQYIPVQSLETGIIYRNVYCAICNSDSRIKQWDAAIECSEKIPISILESGKYIIDNNYYPIFQHWEFRYNDENIRCRIKVKEFENGSTYANLHHARACKPAIDTCAPDWTDPKDNVRCKMYASYIYRQWDSSDENVTVYKNIHCAICNHVDLDYLVCISTDLTPSKKFRGALPILFDFNLKSGERVGEDDHGCSTGEIYDPLRRSCLALHCGRLYKLIDGRCMRNEKAKFLNNSLHSDCPTVSLSEGEYTIMSNQSVYVNQTKRIYHYGEYELSEPTNHSSVKLTICSEYHSKNIMKFSEVQTILFNVCLAISALCLICQIVIYTLVPKLRNLPGKNLLSLACSLLVGQALLIFGLTRNEYQLLCSIIAVSMHFFFLAYFFWMNVMAVDICRTFSSNTYRSTSGSGTFFRYSCYAWWTPTALVSAAIAVDNINEIDVSFRPGYGKEICWITQRKALLLFYGLPIFLIMIVNIFMFSLTVWNIKRSDDFSRKATRRSDKVRLILYIKLALIMGLTWMLALIAPFANTSAIWYPHIILSGLQGAFIFIAFSCKKKVFKLAVESIQGKTDTSLSSAALKRKRDSRSTTMTTNITANNTFNNASVENHNTLKVSVRKPSSQPQTRIKKRSMNGKRSNESDV